MLSDTFSESRGGEMRRTIFWSSLVLLLVGTLTLAFNAGLVHAQAETVYINRDGSVSPSSAPFSSVDNVTYTFTGDVSYPAYNGIIIERNNIVINGDGYTVQGDESGTGLSMTGVSNVTFENTNIQYFSYGIYLNDSDNNVIDCNDAVANYDYGIYLASSSGDSLSGNRITSNGNGVGLNDSSNNGINGNNVTANDGGVGVGLTDSSNNNGINGNDITNNFHGIEVDFSCSSNSLSGNNITNNDDGIWLIFSSSNAISGNNIIVNKTIATNNLYGIYLYSSFSNSIIGNNITANYDAGISLSSSSSNSISGNNITNNGDGIDLASSSTNSIIGNNIIGSNYYYGIGLLSSSSNTIYHNDFINNLGQVYSYISVNAWDDGYPSGGNFWSDYNGTDRYSGPFQNETGSDGIGDTPYVISANNTDGYPLIGVFSDFNVAEGVDVQVVSNSTLSDFQFNRTAILFNVTGMSSTTGFCNVHVPTALISGTLTVFVNGTQVQYTLLPGSNSSYSYLYFTYGHSTEQVVIIPEFPDPSIIVMFMLATLSAIAIYKKKHDHH
jgi:parallel beta-helix repeat protein